MRPALTITPLFNDSSQQILDLILPIQQIEFNVPITLEGQPDLLNVEAFYHQTGGGFWGAKSNDELVGTIAMIATGHQACAVRKMFVKKEYRGKEMGTAELLLNTLLNDCRAKGITDVYLSTVDMLKAAHRFYERNGFERRKSEEMPAYFPRMTPDNVYYHLHLSA
ncbi:GNAT family N-acetyltransferase [Hymenobacter crusticola]|uniref:GNAT family N-acetyltransferase n=1 Tax=Hymenobacter crusticola TaxID=1770526 RepID=A0A243WIS1_9BACT|nr:GNAT family N-acetyltransferase [Hymenobacter crusticola]OUJ75792.1 GNAT family N-acetyltransferase [Hymenobacter crusticola]